MAEDRNQEAELDGDDHNLGGTDPIVAAAVAAEGVSKFGGVAPGKAAFRLVLPELL
jgi:hypothetical protein